MKSKYILTILIILLSACSDEKASNDTPEITIKINEKKNTVPVVTDTKNIIVDGVKMKALDFYKQYCNGLGKTEQDNEICSNVQKQKGIDREYNGMTPEQIKAAGKI